MTVDCLLFRVRFNVLVFTMIVQGNIVIYRKTGVILYIKGDEYMCTNTSGKMAIKSLLHFNTPLDLMGSCCSIFRFLYQVLNIGLCRVFFFVWPLYCSVLLQFTDYVTSLISSGFS